MGTTEDCPKGMNIRQKEHLRLIHPCHTLLLLRTLRRFLLLCLLLLLLLVLLLLMVRAAGLENEGRLI